jgi:hypothetical protein
MQGSAWINLLRRIPADLHDSLALGLVTGAEVVVQQLIRMESDFLIVRGRMAGSTAEARVLLVPYSHMALVAFNKPMPEAQVQEIFVKDAPAVLAPEPAARLPAPRPAGTKSGSGACGCQERRGQLRSGQSAAIEVDPACPPPGAAR